MVKLKAHLWTLPRWFITPFVFSAVLLGALLAGGINLQAWVGFLTALLIMAGGHAFNTVLDYSWTGLDRGEVGERSAEKQYTGGQSVIATGVLSPHAVAINALLWYLLALILLIYLALVTGWPILVVGLAGMLITFWYSRAKFNWTHELALGLGLGPLPVLAGMFAVSAHPPWVDGLLAGIPYAILLSLGGLALDEWPDAEANLRKGVRSLAYMVWRNGVALEWYLSSWFLFMFLYQVFLIVLGILRPLTALSFFAWPLFMAGFVMMKQDFRRWAAILVLIAMCYALLLLAGQYFGR